MVFRRIVHPTDFSAASRPAFRMALKLAKASRAQLFVLHVLPMVPITPDDVYLSPKAWDDLYRSQREAGQRQLRQLGARAKAAGARATGVLIDSGVTHERIVRFARVRRVDLIVMGTLGRSGLARAILGSVASRVIASASCPVMTVRAGIRAR
jgi:nucleotide-binding universal stress UspA family protein